MLARYFFPLALAAFSSLALAQLRPATQISGGEDSVRRGAFQTNFSEQSPLSPLEAQSKRYAIKIEPEGRYQLADQTFEAYVPADYDRERPMGLMVWINAARDGRPPRGWVELLEKHHLIWIGANDSGNERPIVIRLGLALDAVHNFKKQYNIDESRVYVAGISGGAKVATMAAIIYPEVFTGTIPIVGVTYYRGIPLSSDSTHIWQATFSRPTGAILDRAKQQSRFVLITGPKDMNHDSIKDTYDQGFMQDGFRHVEYVEVPGMGHSLPEAQWIDHAINTLDAPLAELAKDQFEKAQTLERAGKIGAAYTAYAQIAGHGGDPAAKASERLTQLKQQRDSQLNLAQQAIEQKRFSDATGILTKLIAQYGDAAPPQANQLLSRIKSDPAAKSQMKEIDSLAALDAARKLVTHDVKHGYEALRKVATDFPNTSAATQATAEAQSLLSDPKNRQLIEADPNENAAQQLLSLAINYENNNLYAQARQRLEKILSDYPTTKAAVTAKERLARLKGR